LSAATQVNRSERRHCYDEANAIRRSRHTRRRYATTLAQAYEREMNAQAR